MLSNDANVEELSSILDVEATIDWFRFAEVNHAGNRPVANKRCAKSRVGAVGEFVGLNPWTGNFLT